MRSAADMNISSGEMSFLQQIRGHADTVKQAAEKAAQLGAEADLTVTAASNFEEQAFRLFKSRKELESATQQMKSREQYLAGKFGEAQVST